MMHRMVAAAGTKTTMPIKAARTNDAVFTATAAALDVRASHPATARPNTVSMQTLFETNIQGG
jgi:hypothetical protein